MHKQEQGHHEQFGLWGQLDQNLILPSNESIGLAANRTWTAIEIEIEIEIERNWPRKCTS